METRCALTVLDDARDILNWLPVMTGIRLETAV
jgi:hypothetical protein